MFGEVPLRPRQEWVAVLRATQDPDTGMPADPWCSSTAALAELGDFHTQYQVLSIGYALECLGSHLERPIRVVERDAASLRALLDAQPWATHAWNAGCLVDAVGTALWTNRRHFGLQGPIEPLFDWLRERCVPHTGLWGEATARAGWLFPVNGFYRITRGTYAAFDRPVPYPEAAIDTVLAHVRHNGGFEESAPSGVTACNVLDVVHPLWLCGRSTAWRRDDARRFLERQARIIPTRWVDGAGFGFAPGDAPGLQGTEMWLAIWWTALHALGLSGEVPFAPRGVHRVA
jgi:hypothetical protein